MISPANLSCGFCSEMVLVVWVFAFCCCYLLDKIWNGAFPEQIANEVVFADVVGEVIDAWFALFGV